MRSIESCAWRCAVLVAASACGPRAVLTDKAGQAATSESERLQAIAGQAYGAIQRAAGDLVDLKPTVSTGVLDAHQHHQRLEERRRPELDGYYLVDRDQEENPSLTLVPGELIKDRPYRPDSPIDQFAIVSVTGTIHAQSVSYDAFLLKYDLPGGGCVVRLVDPALPSVGDFADDSVFSPVFPGCEGPRATARRLVIAAMPGFVIDGFDEQAGAFRAHHTSIIIEEGGVSRGAPTASCGDFIATDQRAPKSTLICMDMWAFGAGYWVRGGTWKQTADCEILATGGCGLRGHHVVDDLRSDIVPFTATAFSSGFECDCCDEYGADVSGGKNSARLLSQSSGTTGAHLAIAKTIWAARTSTGASRSELKLDGDCKGKLDEPVHGAAGAAFDYRSEVSRVDNQANVGAWNADSVAEWLCVGAVTGGSSGTP